MTAPTACHAPPSGGRLALLGRAKLRAEMTTAGETTNCDCGDCLPPPLTDIEAQCALRHVSNQNAVAYSMGLVTLVRYYGCDGCGAWVPSFNAEKSSG